MNITKKTSMVIAMLGILISFNAFGDDTPSYYAIAATGQVKCYDDFGNVLTGLKSGDAFYGQDASYLKGATMSYTDNGDGTITDNVTGLMWGQEQSTREMSWEEAKTYCSNLTLGGYTDWRLPSLKELWSIRDYSEGWPYVNTNYFHFAGDGSEQKQQHSFSSNEYLVNTPLSAKNLVFVVNDWTGHIKALDGRRYLRPVRGGAYGINEFVDNGDNTITDKATGLMWSKDDSKVGMNWKDALAYAENSTYAGYTDWRLPNVKELQGIVDYSGVFPAIDSTKFNVTGIVNEAGNADYPYFWTSTSAGSDKVSGMYFADYVAFGYAVDHDGNDLHGAGAVRFDTKVKDGPSPQDEERIYNYVRLVRDQRCSATLNGNLYLHIPYLSYVDQLSGAQLFWADFLYEFNKVYPASILFKLTNAGNVYNSSYSCAASTLSNDLNIHIPDLLLSDGITQLWVDLEYSAAFSTEGNHFFLVTDYGAVSN